MLKYKIQLYSEGAILERTAVALALTRLRFNRPWILMSTMDLGQHMEVIAVAAFPPSLIGFNHHEDTYTHPNSEHFGSLAWCFLDSVAWAAAVANAPASNKVIGFRGEVMDTSCPTTSRVIWSIKDKPPSHSDGNLENRGNEGSMWSIGGRNWKNTCPVTDEHMAEMNAADE